MSDFIVNNNIHYLVRMLAACFCGILIGYERKNRAKEAGIRTHCIVCFASALIMIISKYAFFDLAEITKQLNMDIRVDPSRIAASIVTGIGFLGTGMIYIHKQSITGLTTAAGIWGTAGIGMAFGSGMYFLGFSATVLMFFAQVVLHSSLKILSSPKHKRLFVFNVTDVEFQKKIEEEFKKKRIILEDINFTYNKETNSSNYVFIIDIPLNIKEAELCEIIDYNFTLKDYD